jgi:ribonuclease I
MQKFWPSYKGPNAEFWKHEWDKHGTCLITYEETLGGSVTTQHDYFAKALELRQDCDLVEALSAEGISPGDTAPAQEIADAISRQCGRKQPQLVCCSQCKENNYLESVYNCYDDEFNLVDCKAVVYKNICEGDVTLPIDNSLATA